MTIRNLYTLFLGISILSLQGLVSCQKEQLTTGTTPVSAKAATDLVSYPIPPFFSWGNLGSIPYTDDIPRDVPISNQWPQGFAINGKGFVCGDLLTTSIITGDPVSDLWQYDTASGNWTRMSPCPIHGGPLVMAVNFVIGDNGYIVAHNQVVRYNQPTNTWTPVASMPGVDRAHATAFSINGKGYVGLGYQENAPGNGVIDLNDWWQYDPATNHWTEMNEFPGNSRDGAAGFSVDGFGYVVSGTHYANGRGNFGKTVWQYDPVRDHWVQKSDFPGYARWSAVAASATVGGVDVGLIAGGDDDGNRTPSPFDDAWEYNPAKDSWAQLPNIIGGARTEAAGFVIGRRLFVANKSVVVLGWSK